MPHLCSVYGLREWSNGFPEADWDVYTKFYELEMRMHGNAYDTCYEQDDKLWVTNGEYESQVNFCPFCGEKAKITVGLPTTSPEQ